MRLKAALVFVMTALLCVAHSFSTPCTSISAATSATATSAVAAAAPPPLPPPPPPPGGTLTRLFFSIPSPKRPVGPSTVRTKEGPSPTTVATGQGSAFAGEEAPLTAMWGKKQPFKRLIAACVRDENCAKRRGWVYLREGGGRGGACVAMMIANLLKSGCFSTLLGLV